MWAARVATVDMRQGRCMFKAFLSMSLIMLYVVKKQKRKEARDPNVFEMPILKKLSRTFEKGHRKDRERWL